MPWKSLRLRAFKHRRRTSRRNEILVTRERRAVQNAAAQGTQADDISMLAMPNKTPTTAIDSLHPTLRRLQDYWQAQRRDRDFPARRDIDPIDFRFALGHVSLIDVLRSPLRFRFRLVATQITEHLGYEMTGKTADQIPEPQVRRYVLTQYRRVVEARRPLIDGGEETLDHRLWRYQAIYLPLSSDGVIIDMLAVGRISERPQAVAWQSPVPQSLFGAI